MYIVHIYWVTDKTFKGLNRQLKGEIHQKENSNCIRDLSPAREIKEFQVGRGGGRDNRYAQYIPLSAALSMYNSLPVVYLVCLLECPPSGWDLRRSSGTGRCWPGSAVQEHSDCYCTPAILRIMYSGAWKHSDCYCTILHIVYSGVSLSTLGYYTLLLGVHFFIATPYM